MAIKQPSTVKKKKKNLRKRLTTSSVDTNAEKMFYCVPHDTDCCLKLLHIAPFYEAAEPESVWLSWLEPRQMLMHTHTHTQCWPPTLFTLTIFFSFFWEGGIKSLIKWEDRRRGAPALRCGRASVASCATSPMICQHGWMTFIDCAHGLHFAKWYLVIAEINGLSESALTLGTKVSSFFSLSPMPPSPSPLLPCVMLKKTCGGSAHQTAKGQRNTPAS